MNSKSMAGWIGFAAILLVIVGGIDFFQGLIALFEDEYYVVSGSGFLVFDLTGWGWTMVIWGVLLVLAGLGLAAGQGWARWFAIVVVGLNFIAQLGFLGNSQYPALVTDCGGTEHHRALRADRTLEREPGRDRPRSLTRSPGWRPSRSIVRDGLSVRRTRVAGSVNRSHRTLVRERDRGQSKVAASVARVLLRFPVTPTSAPLVSAAWYSARSRSSSSFLGNMKNTRAAPRTTATSPAVYAH